MGGKNYTETFTEEGGGKTGKFVSLPTAIAGAFAAAAVAALVVGLAVGLTKKGEDCSAMTTTVTTPGPEVTTASPIFSWDEVRVPTNLSTSHYDLRIRPDFDDAMGPENFKFSGSVVMHLIVQDATNMVVFNLNLLTLKTDSIKVHENDQEVAIINKEHNEKRQYYILTLEKRLTVGSSVRVTVEFEGPIKNDLIGIYYSFYTDDNGNRRYLLGSQMQPTDARKVFPCLDEPNHKATFSIIIERKGGMSSMSNGDVIETVNLGNNWYADYYTTTVRMSTYLLAFVVSDFKCLNSTTASGTRVYVCARPNAIDQAQYAHSVAAPIQQYLQDFYGIPYPLNKTIHLALPDFAAGAMENWGCILYRETALLYDNTSSTAVNQQRVAVVIAHELAHMWFGNLVTPSWWDDLWLNEGFASYMEYWGVDSVQTEWKMHDQFLPEDLHSVMQTDALMTSHPIYQAVDNPDQINSLFDSISYSKGASVIRMMYNFLGEEVFKLGIKEYLLANEFDVAFHTELFDSLTKAYSTLHPGTNLDVTGVMLTWIKQMGYPVVMMVYNSAAGNIAVTQKYFRTFVDPNSPPPTSEYNYRWRIPLSVAHYNGTDFTTIVNGEWLNDATGVINNVPNGLNWIVGNPNELYYYRVNYNTGNWDALINQLSINHTEISDASRAQLIDDSFSLGRAGELDQLVGLRLSGYLDQELDYVPWTAASSSFGYIRRMLAETAYLNDLRSYMQSKFQNVYNSVGWSWASPSGEEETHLNRLLRGHILSLACTYGYKDCTDKAWTNFNLLLNDTTKSQVDLHARSVAYCYGVAAGDVSEWETVLQMYSTSNLATDRAMYLSAMSCADKAHILARYLDLALEEKTIRRQDVATVIVGVSRNRHGQQLAWDFVRYNWNTLFSRFSLFSLSNIVTGVTESFSTERRHAELTAFIKENEGRLGSGERAFIQAAEATRANIEWRNTNEVNIANWLKQQLPSPPSP